MAADKGKQAECIEPCQGSLRSTAALPVQARSHHSRPRTQLEVALLIWVRDGRVGTAGRRRQWQRGAVKGQWGHCLPQHPRAAARSLPPQPHPPDHKGFAAIGLLAADGCANKQARGNWQTYWLVLVRQGKAAGQGGVGIGVSGVKRCTVRSGACAGWHQAVRPGHARPRPGMALLSPGSPGSPAVPPCASPEQHGGVGHAMCQCLLVDQLEGPPLLGRQRRHGLGRLRRPRRRLHGAAAAAAGSGHAAAQPKPAIASQLAIRLLHWHWRRSHTDQSYGSPSPCQGSSPYRWTPEKTQHSLCSRGEDSAGADGSPATQLNPEDVPVPPAVPIPSRSLHLPRSNL